MGLKRSGRCYLSGSYEHREANAFAIRSRRTPVSFRRGWATSPLAKPYDLSTGSLEAFELGGYVKSAERIATRVRILAIEGEGDRFFQPLPLPTEPSTLRRPSAHPRDARQPWGAGCACAVVGR